MPRYRRAGGGGGTSDFGRYFPRLSHLQPHEFTSKFRELSLGELRRVTDLIADLLALGKATTAERRSVEPGRRSSRSCA